MSNDLITILTILPAYLSANWLSSRLTLGKYQWFHDFFNKMPQKVSDFLQYNKVFYCENCVFFWVIVAAYYVISFDLIYALAIATACYLHRIKNTEND